MTEDSYKDRMKQENGKLSFSLFTNDTLLKILRESQSPTPNVMSWHQKKEEENFRENMELMYDKHLDQFFLDNIDSSESDFLRQWLSELHQKIESLRMAGIELWTEQKQLAFESAIKHWEKENKGQMKYPAEIFEALRNRKKELELNELTWRRTHLALKLLKLRPEKEKRRPDESKRISFCFTGKENDLEEFYNRMVGRWIAQETTFEQFKAVFTGQLLREIVPLKWHDDTATEMLYFVVQMRRNGIVEWPNNKHQNHQQMEACFVAPDSNPFQASWPQLTITLTEGGLSEQKQKAIDHLIEALK